jgi:hypothetical protein
MHKSGTEDGPRRLHRFGARVAIGMVFVLVPAITAVTALHFDNAGGSPAQAAAGTPVRPGAGGARPSHAASPTPTAHQPSSPAGVQDRIAGTKQTSNTSKQPAPLPPVTYAGTGPPATASDTSTLSWQQDVSGSGTALLVGIAVGNSDGDSGLSASVTDNGTAMSALAEVHDDNQPFGFLEVFGLAGIPDGTHTISVTVSGGPVQDLTGGSEAFNGAAQKGTFSTPATAFGNGTSPSVTVGSTPGGMIAAFGASGSQFNSTNPPSVQRFIANDDNITRAGNTAGATSAATGGNVTLAWSTVNDFWGAVALEVNN